MGRYQKGKTNLDFTEARDSEWQWHQLGHTQVCTSLQTDNHASTSPLSFFTDRMPFLSPNQQRQSTEGIYPNKGYKLKSLSKVCVKLITAKMSENNLLTCSYQIQPAVCAIIHEHVPDMSASWQSLTH